MMNVPVCGCDAGRCPGPRGGITSIG